MKTKIFIVDDSMVARTMLSRIIKSDDSLEIVGESNTGQSCLFFMQEASPDIILLEADISGGMKVTDVIKEIKTLDNDVKVVLCSDPRTTNLIMPANETGAIDFIHKPYRQHLVLDVINKVKVSS